MMRPKGGPRPTVAQRVCVNGAENDPSLTAEVAAEETSCRGNARPLGYRRLLALPGSDRPCPPSTSRKSSPPSKDTGSEHCPVAEDEAHLLPIEPTGTPNTGNAATAAARRVI